MNSELKNIQIRELQKSDYYIGFLDVLSQLSYVGNISFDDFVRTLQNRRMFDIITYVAYDSKRDKIAGTASLHFDRKFLHNCSPAAYVEDVVVDEGYRGLGIGKILVDKLIQIAKERMCYKILLWCEERNIIFYEKLGFYRTSDFIMRMDI